MPTASTAIVEAKKHARLLLGCYRTGDANDPEVYVAAIVRVLAKYPVTIMAAVCDPATGLPSTLKWLPTISDVVAECERLHGYELRMADRERRIMAQIEERKAIEPPKPVYSAERKLLTYREWLEYQAQNPGAKILGRFDKGNDLG